MRILRRNIRRKKKNLGIVRFFSRKVSKVPNDNFRDKNIFLTLSLVQDYCEYYRRKE